MEAEPRLPWGTRTPRAPPYLPGAQQRLLRCPQLHPLLAGAGPGCRLPAHQSPAHSRCGPAILQPPKRATRCCTWHVLFLFPFNATSWRLLPQGGRGRRETPSWKHSGGGGVCFKRATGIGRGVLWLNLRIQEISIISSF